MKNLKKRKEENLRRQQRKLVKRLEGIVVHYDNDYCFKDYFGMDDLDSMEMRNYICEYSIGNGVKIVKSTILNVEILPDQFGNKKIILDILAEDSKGNLYNIEMQRAPTIADYYRWEYYGARNLSSRLKKGGKYINLKPVYQIIFMRGYAYGNHNLINRYIMRNDNGQQEHENPLMHRIYVSLPAIDHIVAEKGKNNLNEFEKIIYLFEHNEPCDTIEPGKMVNVIMSRYKRMKQNKSIWTMAEKLEEAQMIEESLIEISRKEGLEEGIEKGIERGIEQGIEQGKKERTEEFIKQQISLKYHTDASAWLSSLSSDQLEQAPALILTCDTFESMQQHINQIQS